MTKEEAIENLKGCVCGYEVGKDGNPNGNVTSDLTRETIDMAIKALETLPNDNWEGYSKRLWKSAYERGKADAEQRWIPVSERLPEKYGEYLITWTTSHSMVNGKYGFLGTAEYDLSGEYDHEKNRFKGEWLLEDYIKNYRDVKVIAWMPLPEPYKAESEGECM